MPERQGLIARIRQVRRTSDAGAAAPGEAAPRNDTIALEALRTRIAHLEQLVEALQDSVYRESQRHSKRITELEAQIQPAALSIALSKDARERGI
jgi:hypothetical protein